MTILRLMALHSGTYLRILVFKRRNLTVIFILSQLGANLQKKVTNRINGPGNMALVHASINRGVRL